MQGNLYSPIFFVPLRGILRYWYRYCEMLEKMIC